METSSHVARDTGNPFHSINTSSSPFSIRRSRIRCTANTSGRGGLRLEGSLDADGGGRRTWEDDGDSASEESLRGRFLVRDDEKRDDAGVGDEVIERGATVDSIVLDTKHEASDVVEECFVFTAQGQLLEQAKATTTGKETTKFNMILECKCLKEKKQ